MVELLGVVFAQLALIALLVRDMRAERREAAAERAQLLQRIQAPEMAAVAHDFAQSRPVVTEMPFDDDEAFHATREEMAAALSNGRA